MSAIVVILINVLTFLFLGAGVIFLISAIRTKRHIEKQVRLDLKEQAITDLQSNDENKVINACKALSIEGLPERQE